MNIETIKASDGNRYIRYRLWKDTIIAGFGAQTQHVWKLLRDSDYVLDHNAWADLTEYGLGFAYVFHDTSSPVAWGVDIGICKVTWGPV